MEKLRFFISLLIIFLFLLQSTSAAREFSVGVSPSLIDLGELYAGSSNPVSFFVVTASDETILVYLESREALIDFFNRPGYNDYIYNYSQEATVGWIQTFSNPVELKPSSETSTLGGSVRGWREINFLLNVPKNAEPGYHLVKIFPRPSLPSGEIGQVGVQIATVTPISIFFKVPGDAIRQGRILDITTGKKVGNNLELLTHFINTGTVTISARASDIKVYDKNGNLTAKLTSDTKLVKPKEKQILIALLPLSDIKNEEYFVSSNVNFITGDVQKNSTIKIYPELTPVPAEIVSKPFQIPLWILILIVLMILIIVYRRMNASD